MVQLETVTIPIMRPKSNSTLGSNSSSSLTNLTSINSAINYGKVKYFKTPEMIGLKKLNRNPLGILQKKMSMGEIGANSLLGLPPVEKMAAGRESNLANIDKGNGPSLAKSLSAEIDMKLFYLDLINEMQEKYLQTKSKLTDAEKRLQLCLLYTSPSPRDS